MGIRKSRLFMFVFLCLCIVAISFFAYFKQKNINFSDISIKNIIDYKFSKKSIPLATIINEIKFDSSTNTAFAVIKDNILECSGNHIRILDSEGGQLRTFSVSMNKPVISAEGEYTAVFDAGGREIYVFRNDEKIWNKTLDDSIINANINEKGLLSVIHKDERYKSVVSIFNLQGMELFSVGKADRYMISCKISPNAKSVVYNCIDTSGIKVNTSIQFSDILGKLSKNSWLKEDAIFPSSWYVDNDSLILIGDSGVALLKNEKEKWYKNIPGNIFSAAKLSDKYVALAVSREEKKGLFASTKTDIAVLGLSGELTVVGGIEDSVKNMTIKNSIIALNTGKIAYFMDSNGRVLSRYMSQQEIENVLLYKKDKALVVGRSSVYVVEFN